MEYLKQNRFKIAAALLLCLFAMFGWLDASAATAGVMLVGDTEQFNESLDIIAKALSEYGISLKSFIEKQTESQKSINDRLMSIEQKQDRKPGGAPEFHPGEIADLLMKSEGLTAFQKGTTRSVEITVPARMFKAAILNPNPLSNDNPLVPVDRRPGIVAAPQRRLTIRDLFPGVPTTSNLVEFCKESVYTNNAGPQYDASSPDPHSESAIKNESGMTFALGSTPVITLAHWIPASRQILSDAPALQNHVEQRLLYGLKLEEENELLNGTGANGQLNGLINNATQFTRGSTNLTALDAVALGIAQLVASEYEPSGVIVNPADWWSSKFVLAKNTYGEYLLGNPADMAQPRLWGLPVVVTNTMPAGNFMVLDAARTGYIADREDAIVRIAEQHADFFVRNMVVILVEERLAIVIQLSAAMVYGALSYAG